MNALRGLRQVLVKVTAMANADEGRKDVRRLVAMAAGSIRRPGGLRGAVEGIAAMQELKDAETGGWVAPDALLEHGGRFDSCNLQHWVVLAEAAGIPAIPARPILTLTEEEISVLSGKVEMPDTPATRALRREAGRMAEEMGAVSPDLPLGEDGRLTELRRAAAAKTFDAMDDVPEGWMVRHERCGPSVLKTLAGSGIAGGEAPDVAFGADLSIGPGWVRHGNRRRVDVTDKRTLSVGIGQGPDAPHTWLARPWVRSSRWTQGPDPHRHGTPFEGSGFWPAEWRVFVEGGRVTGVSYYYPWAGMAGPQDAANALAVRDVAQRMVDKAIGLGAVPAFMDVEFARGNPQFKEMGFADRFPRDGFACCLDFMETEAAEGMTEFTFLEGGPPLCVFGGAHPCGFIPVVGKTHRADGVALRLPEGVHMMEPSTWNVPVDGAILTWDEAEALAAELVPGMVP